MENSSTYYTFNSTLFENLAHELNFGNSSHNGTLPNCPFRSDKTLQTRFIMIPIICMTIIIANFIVVISSGLILKKGQEPRTTYLFLGNIAMADLLTGLSVLLHQIVLQRFPSHHMCVFLMGLLISGLIVSGYSVGLIGIDRFFYILHGMKYEKYINPTRARILIGVVWIFGCGLGMLPLTGWVEDSLGGTCCFFLYFEHREYLMMVIITKMVPAGVVLVLYSVILYRAIKKVNELNQTSTNNANTDFDDPTQGRIRMFRGSTGTELNVKSTNDNKPKNILQLFRKTPGSQQSRWKAVKVVFFTTGSFIFTLMPLLINNFTYAYYCKNGHAEICDTLLTLNKGPLLMLLYVNCLLNPVIYAWWHKGFRKFIQNRIRIFKIKHSISTPNISVTTVSTSASNGSISSARNHSTTVGVGSVISPNISVGTISARNGSLS